MKTLSLKEMENVEGGKFSLCCAAAIAGGALFVASLFIVPVGAAVAFYAVNATVGPSIVGVGIGTACS